MGKTEIQIWIKREDRAKIKTLAAKNDMNIQQFMTKAIPHLEDLTFPKKTKKNYKRIEKIEPFNIFKKR